MLSVILYCFYEKNMKLDDGTYHSEKELKNLVNFIAYSFGAHSIRKVEILQKDVVDICTKVRAVVFQQMSSHAFWTMFFGLIELSLFWIGHEVIQPYTDEQKVLICYGQLQLDWKEVNQIGGLFMTAHGVILSLSAATIVKTFYLIPR